MGTIILAEVLLEKDCLQERQSIRRMGLALPLKPRE